MIVNARFLSQPVTGVQRHAIEISKALMAIQPDTTFVAPRKIVNHAVAEILNPLIVGRRSGYYWEQIELPRFLRKHRRKELLVSLANMAPVYYGPQIVTIHDTAPLRHPEWYSLRFSTVYRLLIPMIARRADVILTDSLFARDEIAQVTLVDKARIRVVHCAVPSGLTGDETETVRDADGPYVLAVASFDPRKNLNRLVEAFLKLNRSDLRLVVVGADNSAVFNLSGLGAILKSHENVVLAGSVDDHRLRRLYANAELFVYPSLYEGFGLPPLEAMAAGCPCLVSRAASLPEVCADAVEYCDPTDIDDIAGKMRTLLADKSKMNDLRTRGRMRAGEFSWEKSAEKIIEIAKGIAQR
ncbi:MAG TPA: glycosyltransferase family 1 protein [candidate division Zixibacteria bacterium]|nr:glycosyltransferase family 1 protein [candidate division Zixibacteria bacterium]